MPTKVLKGLRIPADFGFEGIFRTFDFVTAKPGNRAGILEVTIRPRYLLVFRGRTRTYCGVGAHWRGPKGEKPSLIEALYLNRVWLVAIRRLLNTPKATHENPLRV